MGKLNRLIRSLSKLEGGFLAICLLGLALMVFVQVVNRYFLAAVMSVMGATEELARLLIVWLTFGGAAWCLKQNSHIRMGDVVTRLPGKTPQAMDFLADVLLVGISILMLIYGVQNIIQTSELHTAVLRMSQTTFNASFIVGFGLMLVEGVRRIARRIIPTRR